jgi:DNA-binding LacI/PurR family transcriptional regulator
MPRYAQPKHAHVFATLQREITNGRWKRGDRLPSEAELVDRFGLSRITVGRAMRDLQAAGMVDRRAGSGSYVSSASAQSVRAFGLLIPNLGESEIFEPICQGMMSSPLAREHDLLWGSGPSTGESREDAAWALCQHYIGRRVSGVFFAPLEFSEASAATNQRIGDALDAAGIPLVLLDRPLQPWPAESRHDLVGIDNRRAGYVMTTHLLRQGCTRLAFVGMPNAASTVDAREAGYREAAQRAGLAAPHARVHRIDPDDAAAVAALMEGDRPDGIVCANDRTAGQLMHALRRLGVQVPRDTRLVGMDDVEYARLLPVPLTTLRQPTRHIGETALAAMLERVQHRDLPPRDIRLHCELIVRESCGAGSAT